MTIPADTEAAPDTFINGEEIPDGAPSPEAILDAATEQLDDLELQVESRDWAVVGDITVIDPRSHAETALHFERTYTQKPLSYTAMLQFTGLIGDRISTVMGQGVTLDSVLGDVGSMTEVFNSGDLSKSDFSGIDSFVRGLAKLATYLPDVVEESQCIWLRVPLHERQVVREIWGRSPVDGGQSMQQGEEMMNLFIAQNYQELEDFFVERLPRVLRQAQKARTARKLLRTAGDLLLSRPSSSTPPATPSQ